MAGRLARVRSKADSALDGHRYESTDSSDDEAMRAVPAGCLGRTGVRLVAEARAGEDERGSTGEKGYSVVDTNQFRNTQVGSGYQASFVVRQPGTAPSAPPSPAPATCLRRASSSACMFSIISSFLSLFCFAACDFFLLTILPLLFLISISFVSPPLVLLSSPFQTRIRSLCGMIRGFSFRSSAARIFRGL